MSRKVIANPLLDASGHFNPMNLINPYSFSSGVPTDYTTGLTALWGARLTAGSDSAAISPLEDFINAHDGTAAAGEEALLRTGVNGINNVNAFSFDGTNDMYTGINVPINQVFTINGVFVPLNVGATYQAICTQGGTRGLYFMKDSRKLNWYEGSDHLSTTALTFGTPYCFSLVSDGANITFYINKVADGTHVLAVAATTLSNIGNDGIGDFAGFKLGELRPWGDQTVSTPNRNAAEDWEIYTYGI